MRHCMWKCHAPFHHYCSGLPCIKLVIKEWLTEPAILLTIHSYSPLSSTLALKISTREDFLAEIVTILILPPFCNNTIIIYTGTMPFQLTIVTAIIVRPISEYLGIPRKWSRVSIVNKIPFLLIVSHLVWYKHHCPCSNSNLIETIK